MANTKSAKKRILVSRKKAMQNKMIKSRTKTAVKKARKAIMAGGIKDTDTVFVGAMSFIDKAATKGVIHRNTAARRKSRLAKALNKVNAQ